jgi:hypothetical protein
MMASVVYVLCAATSLLCAVLLLRAHSRSGVRLLLFSGLCFAALTLENVALIADRMLFPNSDLSLLRNALGLLGPAILVFGLVSEAE